jgi:phosphate transport system ATP-binding protein
MTDATAAAPAANVLEPQAVDKVVVRDLDFYYGQSLALKKVTLSLREHHVTAFIGPSGCGKSTFLRCLNRMNDTIESARVEGEITLDGVDIYERRQDVVQLRARVGMVFQKPNPFPKSIYENIAYGPRIHGLVANRADLDEVVQTSLQKAGLWDEVKDRLHAPAANLSVGQQQRLCLARGLAVEPEILLGDEPTSALDPISAQHIERRLMDLKSDYTIVLVTHILRQARRLADYVIFMYLGEVVECGPAHEVFDHPRQERTQAYLAGQF